MKRISRLIVGGLGIWLSFREAPSATLINWTCNAVGLHEG
jgi:hypothetical protein